MNRENIVDIIVSSLKDLISAQDKMREIPLDSFNESTYLIGSRSFVDSLTLVSLIVDVEQKLSDEYGIIVIIADERALSQEKSPFKTIGTLAEYIQLLMNEQKQNA